MNEPEITAFVCGGDLCVDGKPHDSAQWVEFRAEDGMRGGSAACSRCGSLAMDRDLMRLP